MADPVGFEGANVLMRGHGDVRDMDIFADGTQFIGCWRLSAEEIMEIIDTGVVWVSITQTGDHGPPPSYVSGKALVTIEGRPAKAEPIMPKVHHGDRDNG